VCACNVINHRREKIQTIISEVCSFNKVSQTIVFQKRVVSFFALKETKNSPSFLTKVKLYSIKRKNSEVTPLFDAT